MMGAFLAWVLASQSSASGPSPTSIATIGSLMAMVSSVVGSRHCGTNRPAPALRCRHDGFGSAGHGEWSFRKALA